jgi:16S rRNA (guanine527-N7)-methyltransferase
LFPQNARLVDIGSGAGAPALPLMVLRADLSGVLVEPRRKRVAFLRTAVGSLGLTDSAEIREGRIEPDSPQVQGQPFDVAISRATFTPEVWVAIGSRLSRRTLVLTAGAEPPAPPAGVARGESRTYRLPGSGAPRRVTAYLS